VLFLALANTILCVFASLRENRFEGFRIWQRTPPTTERLFLFDKAANGPVYAET